MTCDLGEYGIFNNVSTTENGPVGLWAIVGRTFRLPDALWPGYRRRKGTTACRVVGFHEQFTWPPKELQSSAASAFVECVRRSLASSNNGTDTVA